MKNLLFASFVFLMMIFEAKAQYQTSNASINPKNDHQLSMQSDTSQHITPKPENIWDHLTIISDSRIDTLLQIHREENMRKKGLVGYNLQIFEGSKEDAYKIKARFLALYPHLKPYVSFPHSKFVVRIGFRTNSEALKLKNKIKSEFPNTFIVEGEINFSELNKE